MEHLQLPSDARRGPNCGVTAIAAATGESFQRVWALCAARSSRKRFKGGTIHNQRVEVLEHLQADFQPMQMPRMTLDKFCNWYADDDTTYMVTTTGHVQLVRIINSEPYVLDQTGCKPLSEYWGRRKYISRDVLKMGEPKRKPVAAPQPTPQQPAKFCKCGASLRTGSNLCACDKQPTPGFTHTSLFPALFTEQQPAQSAQQLNLF
jgi:hypothetical protein